MSKASLLFIVFVEGFASLGIEVIALRRLVPHVGSAITVTAPTIALFLLALAVGYWSGGRIRDNVERRVARNFLVAAVIAGVGLSGGVVQLIFASFEAPFVAYLVFMSAVVCPSACLLAQTVPLISHAMGTHRAGDSSAMTLTASTAGSVLGALILSLVVMQLAGVSAAVALCCGSLCAAAAVQAVGDRHAARTAWAMSAMLALLWWNIGAPKVNALETAYADYRTVKRDTRELPADYVGPARVFLVNNQQASILDSSQPPRRSPYIERMRRLLLDELGFRGKRVLVLGAGGFTFSLGDTGNEYTYVDIDPPIKEVAEKQFLHGAIHGRFFADDARRFVSSTAELFDAIVVDVYTSPGAVPAHLLTAEFWRSVRRVTKDGGVAMVNFVLDPELRTSFARNALATVEQELGRCSVEVMNRDRALSNVVMACMSPTVPPPAVAYSDERSSSDVDRAMLLR